MVAAAAASGVVIFMAPFVNPMASVRAAAFCTIAFLLVNVFLVGAYAVVISRKVPLSEFVGVAVASIVATSFVNIPIVALISIGFEAYGVWVLPVVFVPLVITQYFHWLYQRKSVLTDELADSAETLAKANLQFAAAMVRALDARDSYTAGHSAAVAVYCRDIAHEAGFDQKTVRLAHLAGLLHDIGKIGVPGSVLNATRALTDDEYEIMKDHAAIGAGILSEVDSYAEISTLVRYHHERIDGTGYPEGIGGDLIPSISRIISVADTYSAMTTDRPYRDGMPTAKAMSILEECRGTQLDDTYADCFLRILARESEQYQRGKLTDFEVEVAKHQALGTYEQQVIEKVEAEPADIEQQPAAEQTVAESGDSAAA